MSFKEKRVILVTNDDGINSDGIKNLRLALMSLGTVYVVAPDSERSSSGHAITLRRPINLTKIDDFTFAITGTPADCVEIACRKILDKMPDLIASGINIGSNLGIDTYYSGTFAAAVEGAILKIPSFAISVPRDFGDDFSSVNNSAQRVAQYILEKGLPENVLLNVNHPSSSSDKYKMTFMGRKKYNVSFTEDNFMSFSAVEKEIGIVDIKGSDCNAVNDGFISITPIKLDSTAYEYFDSLKEIEKW